MNRKAFWPITPSRFDQKFPVGTMVHKHDKQGLVVWPVPPSYYSDGSYYAPECNDIVTYVHWEDGSTGWVYTNCLEEV